MGEADEYLRFRGRDGDVASGFDGREHATKRFFRKQQNFISGGYECIL